jgi:hypothetical protein
MDHYTEGDEPICAKPSRNRAAHERAKGKSPAPAPGVGVASAVGYDGQMAWNWVIAALVVTFAIAIYAMFVSLMNKIVLLRIARSRCRKCAGLLGPQTGEADVSHPGANLHYRIVCGNCGARFVYDQHGEFEHDWEISD